MTANTETLDEVKETFHNNFKTENPASADVILKEKL